MQTSIDAAKGVFAAINRLAYETGREIKCEDGVYVLDLTQERKETMSIYHVKHEGKDRLVEAKTKSAAIAHIVGDKMEVKSVTASDLYSLIQSGHTVEKAE